MREPMRWSRAWQDGWRRLTVSAACPGIKFISIGMAEVESKIKALDELAFTGIKQLKGIRKIHHIEV